MKTLILASIFLIPVVPLPYKPHHEAETNVAAKEKEPMKGLGTILGTICGIGLAMLFISWRERRR